jgi:hypothetical protein
MKKRIAPLADAYASSPLVAVKSFAEDAEGRPHFKTRAAYNLPQTPCPALADMVEHAKAGGTSVAATRCLCFKGKF